MLILSKKEDDQYQAWLNDVKSQHKDVAPILDQLATTDAGRELFRGGLRTADYYRRLNEFRDEKEKAERDLAEKQQAFQADVTKQYSWWQEAQTNVAKIEAEKQDLASKLTAYEAQLKEYGVDTKSVISQAPANGGAMDNLTQREIAEIKSRVQAMDQNFPAVMMGLLKAQQSALTEGLPFDPTEVFKRVYQQRVDPVTAFNDYAKPFREEKAKQILSQELDKAREEGRREALSKLSGPDRAVRPSSPSAVDALRTSDNPVFTDRGSRVDAAVKDFMEMELGGQA